MREREGRGEGGERRGRGEERELRFLHNVVSLLTSSYNYKNIQLYRDIQ